MRKYKIKTRWLDGIQEDIIEADDVDKAIAKLAKKLKYPKSELNTITESITIWDTISEKWVSHKPWWEEEKEAYNWEKDEMTRGNWGKKVEKATKIGMLRRGDPRLTRPMVEAMFALDQIKAFHGHTPFETHGFSGFRFLETFPPKTDKWDKNYEYKIFLKDAILNEETSYLPEDRTLDEHGWMSLESYAVEDTGVDEDIVYKGHIFRENYVGCSQRLGCVKRESKGVLNIDNKCRQKCQDEAAEKSSFFKKKELEHIRKTTGLMV